MSTGNAALALALGAGAGLGLWYLLRDDKDDGSETPAEQAPASPTSSPAPVSNGRPCVLRLDAAGLTADGVLVDISSAVDRCKNAGAAELHLADDAPGAVSVRLAAALQQAGVTLSLSPRRNGRPVAKRGETRNATTHQIFLFRSAPKNGSSRTRFYQADPRTTWDDAKRRLAAAGLLDDRILLPTEWSLVADPPLRVPADHLRPLP